MGVARVEWDTRQVMEVPGGKAEGCTVRWEEREMVPSLYCWWLERETWSDRMMGSVSVGERDSHSI